VTWPRFTVTILDSREKLRRILELVTPPGDPVPAPVPIDYTRREGIVYALGPRSSTGYDVRVLRVREEGDRITVTLHESSPALGDRVTAKLTYPYRLITIPRTTKRPRFVFAP
jgi:hypothetical protein